jgi:ABC-type nitrate/sulfonate/bicarbonate transport system permease component
MIFSQCKRILLFLSLIAIWEMAGRMGFVNHFLLPAPSVILQREIFKDTKILSHILSSLFRVIVGFSIAIIAGVSFGFFIGLNKTLRFYLMPIFSILKPIPPIAWIPITILWFGLGNGPSFFVTMIASFFPIFFNTMAGIEDMDQQYLNVAQCFGASRSQIFKEVIFPYTLPFIFSGLRIGLGVAWMSVIAAEIVSASSGLGYMIEISQQMLRVDNVIVGMIAIGLCGIILDRMIQKLSLRFTSWKA